MSPAWEQQAQEILKDPARAKRAALLLYLVEQHEVVDPIQNLQEQLAVANSIVNDPAYPSDGDIYRDTKRLAELVIALDEWMRKGGFSPWTPTEHPSRNVDTHPDRLKRRPFWKFDIRNWIRRSK